MSQGRSPRGEPEWPPWLATLLGLQAEVMAIASGRGVDPDELFQQVALALARARLGHVKNLRAYVLRIAVNEANRLQQRGRRGRGGPPGPEPAAPDDPGLAAETRDLLRALRQEVEANFSADHLWMYDLRLRGFAYADVAERVGATETCVRQAMARILNYLRDRARPVMS